MKSKMIFKLCVVLISILAGFSGCKEEYKSTTKINSDGSCERIITIKADSFYIYNNPFPIPVDKSWDPQFKRIEKDTQKVFVVHKQFDDVNKINGELNKKDKIGVEIKFEKKFRWFYSYLVYKETYKAYSPFRKIPLAEFLTKNEFQKYANGDTTKAMKERIDKYFMENIFEYFYENLISAVSKLNDSALPTSLIASNKQILRDTLMAGKGETKSIMNQLSKILKSKLVWKLESDVTRIMNEINTKMSEADVKFDYTNEIIMPGLILSTNSTEVEGSRASWKFGADRFQFIDYVMVVESRVANVWAIIVTAILTVGIILLLLLPRFRKTV